MKTLIRARPRQPRPPGMQGAENSIDALYALLGIAQPTAALPVNDKTVRGLPAAWAAQNRISNAVAQMLVGAQCFASDGTTELDCPDVVTMPDSALDSFVFWKTVAGTALCQGNWVGLKADYDFTGFPRQVIGVPSGSVHAYYDESGYLIYEISGEDFTPDDVVHVRCGVTLNGEPWTVGVIEAHRRGLQGMLAQQGMSNSVWQTGAVPSGIIQLDVDLPTREQATTVKENWVSVVGGARTVAVTGKRQTFTPIQWSADDAQFIQSQQFTVAQIALMFGLHPSDLDASIGGASLTYGNRQEDSLQRIVDAYVPVMLPIEQCWSRLIPGRNFVRGNVEALLRSTTMQRYEAHALAQSIGLETKDETRAIEGKSPLPKEEPAPIAEPVTIALPIPLKPPPSTLGPYQSRGTPMSKYESLLVRAAEITDVSSDGRNIDGRAFFFDKPSWVSDPGVPKYLEEFARRSVDTTLKMRALRPVFKNHNYLSGSWAEATFEPDGESLLFHARATDSEYATKTLQEVIDGELRGASVGFRSLRSMKRSDPRGPVTVHTEIVLEELSFAQAGMHEGAGVLAVRSGETPRLDDLRKRKLLLPIL